MLTPQSRDFYFALQDLLRLISNTEWHADRSQEVAGSAANVLREALTARKATGAITVLDYFSTSKFADWESKGVDLGKEWRSAANMLGADWKGLTERQRFATLQQIGSKLRTSLVNDLDSRER